MTRAFSNPYLWVLVAPLSVFITAMLLGIDPDAVSLVGRFYYFGLLGYVGARYVGRAPILMAQGDFSPEARNIAGWAILIVAAMLTQLYAWLVIVYDRPTWLIATYWISGLVILSGVGVTLVASSVPRFPFPPFGHHNSGLSVWVSFIVGFLSAGLLFMAQHIPHALRFLSGYVMRAF
jgi:hypothetical protein